MRAGGLPLAVEQDKGRDLDHMGGVGTLATSTPFVSKRSPPLGFACWRNGWSHEGEDCCRLHTTTLFSFCAFTCSGPTDALRQIPPDLIASAYYFVMSVQTSARRARTTHDPRNGARWSKSYECFFFSTSNVEGRCRTTRRVDASRAQARQGCTIGIVSPVRSPCAGMRASLFAGESSGTVLSSQDQNCCLLTGFVFFSCRREQMTDALQGMCTT